MPISYGESRPNWWSGVTTSEFLNRATAGAGRGRGFDADGVGKSMKSVVGEAGAPAHRTLRGPLRNGRLEHGQTVGAIVELQPGAVAEPALHKFFD